MPVDDSPQSRSPSKLLSIILLSYQSEGRMEAAVDEIIRTMEAEQIPFEVIIVDDGSTDRSPELARSLAARDSRVRTHQLSKNYGSPYSTFAGLSVAGGACAVAIPDDGQSPPGLVVEMYRLWEQGHTVVVAHRRSRYDGRINDLFSRLYYWIMNRFSEVEFPPGGSDRFLADREVIDILNTRIRPINTTPILEVLRLGFSPHFLSYDRPRATGVSRWTLKKKIRLASDTFFGSSSYPLRLITVLGFGIFAFCLLLILAIVWARLFTDYTVFGLATNGWATTMVVMTMFNGLILLCIGIVAEYIWRIHEEVKGRPGFVIREAKDGAAKAGGSDNTNSAAPNEEQR
jgi:dolichol-phosphate mannosyltransferase